MAMELILVINSGSSSHKCCLFQGGEKRPIWQERLDWKEGFTGQKEGLIHLLKSAPQVELTAIGHRVVHGGETFQGLTSIDEGVKKKIQDLAYLAPLHNPANLQGIITAESLYPRVPQFALFDTAFHSTLKPRIATYPLPLHWKQKGVRRYGFHGLSYAYCSKRAARLMNKQAKMVICHLGAGASLCAVEKGKSVNTTMGMTPLEGLMMASRCGSIDPGIVLHLQKQEHLSVDEVDHMLNYESGLLGVSGVSEDVRLILESISKGNQQAELAFEMFIERLVEDICKMTATMRGIEALVFTAGIGEHAALVREEACAALRFLDLKLDHQKNQATSLEEREISTVDSGVRIFVIPTHEEYEIASQIRAQLS